MLDAGFVAAVFGRFEGTLDEVVGRVASGAQRRFGCTETSRAALNRAPAREMLRLITPLSVPGSARSRSGVQTLD